MRNLSYQELVEEKRRIQQKKEAAIRMMSPDDWERSSVNMGMLSSEGRLPPKIKSRRHYRENGFVV